MTIYDLIAHLRKCPPDFLTSSNLIDPDGVHTEALIADVYRAIVGDNTQWQFDILTSNTFKNATESHLITVQIACWLLSHEAFRGDISSLVKVDQFLSTGLGQLSKYVKPQKWLEEEDRAEEMVRLALKYVDKLIDGENAEEAEDRLAALSTIKRLGVLEKSNEAYERMREIRRKMAEQKAREAANPYGRE